MTRVDGPYCDLLEQVCVSMGPAFMLLLDEVVGERLAKTIDRTADRALARLQIVDEDGDRIGTFTFDRPLELPLRGARPAAPPV